MKLEHYWLCSECARDKGGVFPEGHACTVMSGKCPYCDKENVTLIPWVDFDFPKDKKLDKKAKGNRD